jgi:hypothetical protein
MANQAQTKKKKERKKKGSQKDQAQIFCYQTQYS